MAFLKSKRRRLKAVIVIALIAFAVCLALQRRREVSEEQSNGFPLLIEASKQIVGTNPLLELKPPAKERIQNFVFANQPALQTLRKALSMPCTIPLAEAGYLNPFFCLLPISIEGLRELGLLFLAEGKWHELEGRFDQAAQSYFDAMRLGLKMRGGLVAHKFVGHDIAEMGQKALLLIEPKLSAKASERIARELLLLLDEGESWDEVWERGSKFARRLLIRRLFDFPRKFVQSPREAIEGLRKLLKEISELKKLRKELAPRLALNFRLHQISFALTATELALHAFQQKEKRLPETLDELVPKYLPKLPSDEINGKPFVYRVVNGEPKVYSVGHNGKDENGKGDDVTARLWERWKDNAFRKAYLIKL